MSRATIAIAMLLPCLLVISSIPSGAPAISGAVSVFPIPGSRVVSPTTQIAFRGVPAGQLGAIVVTGSRSGRHLGAVLGDSDGQGGSFVPAKPFTPGEIVTVVTSLHVLGAKGGTFQFTVATPAGGIPPAHWPPAPRTRGDVTRFRSRPDLAPASVTITKRGRTASGDIFVAPQFGRVQDGLMILDPRGGLIWWNRLTGDSSASDFRVQHYQGKPVLTWWQGYVNAGVGTGDDVIDDASYHQVATVHAANGLSADLHEFEITPAGTALITAYYPVYWDTSAIHGAKRQVVLDSVVQEIDIPTGLLLFQWDSLDHVPLGDTYEALPKSTRAPFDYFHVNSVEPDRDGSVLISSRNTWSAYKVNHQTGAIIWTLGGKHSSFRMGAAASFAFQHDVRVRADHDWFVTLFDDGGGPPTVHSQSRGLKLFLDVKHMFAKTVGQDEHGPPLQADFEGNYQQLASGEDFLGWGQQAYFTEYNSHGKIVFDGHFVDPTASYRVYRFAWNGAPQTRPAVVAANQGRHTVVYVSWNGATNVASWRVMGGSSATALPAVRTASKRAFETAITVGAQRYVAVEALDGRGRVLSTSATVRVH